jgi:hypothetical protein
MGDPVRLQHQQPFDMKTLAVIAALAIALMLVITSCSDRTRDNCESQPTAQRCNP